MANNKKTNNKSVRKQAAKDLAKDFGKQLSNTGDILVAAETAIKRPVKGTVDAAKALVNSVKTGFKSVKDLGKLIFNHPEWYENYPLSGMINLNYGRRKGNLEEPLTINYQAENALNTSKIAVPSVCALSLRLTKPLTDTKDWNQGIQYLYSNIRSANSGSVNYSPYQLERYVLDVRNMHAIYAFMRRAYALLNNVSMYDSTTPRSYFSAMGLDFDSFNENAAQLREWANKLSIQLNRLLPLNIDLYNRTRWLFSNVFADSNDLKSSKYIFTIDTIVNYSKDQPTLVTISSKPTKVYSNEPYVNFSVFYNTVNSYMHDLISNNVYNIIAGDILKTFGESAIYPVEIWDMNMEAPEIYDEAALTQIQNTSIFSGITSTTTINDSDYVTEIYTCNNDVLSPKDTAVVNRVKEFSNIKYINSYKNSMTPGETISFTRLAALAKFDSTNIGTISHCGTEIVSDISVIGNVKLSTDTMPKIRRIALYAVGNNVIYEDSTQKSGGGKLPGNINNLFGTFDWCPMMILIQHSYYKQTGSDTATDTFIDCGVLWDFNNYAVTDSTNISSLHGYAALSLLSTPRLLKQSNASLLR